MRPKSRYARLLPRWAAERIRVVLVEPYYAGNIGAAARSLRAFGLRRLALVRPTAFGEEAEWWATGGKDVLERATRHETLAEAAGDCGVVLGFTARPRRDRDSLPLEAAVDEALAAARAGNKVAFVFGTERTGLTNEDVDLCTRLAQIPTVPDFRSLNLAQAVLLAAAEVHRRAVRIPASSGRRLAPAAEVEATIRHVERGATAIGFLRGDWAHHGVRILRGLLGRAAIDRREVALLRAMAGRMERVAVRAGLPEALGLPPLKR